MRPNRRKIWFITPLQNNLVIRVMIVLIAASMVTTIASMIILNNNYRDFLTPAQAVIVFALITLPTYVLSFIYMILLSNKIYGPIHRLSRYMERLNNGEKTGELLFRKGDAIDHINEIYNRLYKKIEKSLTFDYKECAKIFSELEDLLDRIYQKKVTEKEIYEIIQSISGRLARALDITSETLKTYDLD